MEFFCKEPCFQGYLSLRMDHSASRLFQQMFGNEDPSGLASRYERMTITSQYSTDMQRYTRAAIVALLRLVKVRVIVDWDKVMGKSPQGTPGYVSPRFAMCFKSELQE